MQQSIKVRDAISEDIKEIILILQEISHYFPKNKTEDQIWEDFSSQQNIFPRVITHNNQVVGFANLLVERNIRGGILGHIGDVAIRSDMQGKGIGRVLINDLKNIADGLGCYKLVLSCDNKSLDFYKKLGFTDLSNSAAFFLKPN